MKYTNKLRARIADWEFRSAFKKHLGIDLRKWRVGPPPMVPQHLIEVQPMSMPSAHVFYSDYAS